MIEKEIIKLILKEYPQGFKISGHEHLHLDLKFDSLGFMSLLLDIEEKYQITFEIHEFEDCLYLNNLISLVNQKLGLDGE